MTDDDPVEPTSSASPVGTHWARRPPTLAEYLERADLVVVGRVLTARSGTVTVHVDEVLRGDEHAPGATVAVALGSATDVPSAGVWILGPGDPRPMLISPEFAPLPRVRRILSGGAAWAVPPPPDSIRLLADGSDVVVFARIDAADADHAVAEVEETLKGDPPERLEIHHASSIETWAFATAAPSYGVLFLARTSERWEVLNDAEPPLYHVNAVRDALG